jgi:hypothetical protein
MSAEDYVKIIDEKNKEIAELQFEVELLKKALASTHSLEELVIPDNSVTDDANITLKAPEEDDEPNEQPGNMMDIMSLMSMLMNASKGGEGLEEAECDGLGDTLDREDDELDCEGEALDCEGDTLDREDDELDCEGEALDCEGEALDCEGEALDCEGEALDCEGEALDCEGEALDCEGEALDCEGEALDKSLDEALSE